MLTFKQFIFENELEESSKGLRRGKAIVAAAGIGVLGMLAHDAIKNRPPKITKAKQVDNIPKTQKDVDDELKIMRNRK